MEFLTLQAVKRQSLIAGALKLIPRVVCDFLIRSGILNFISSYFTYAHLSLKEVVDKLTDNKDLKAVLSYNFGDYGRA